MKVIFCTICLMLTLSTTNAWDTEELEIFDLVEDINENFYTILGVQQDAKLSEIKKAFRNLSVQLHPDKNSAEDANVKFRNLVFVYEVLKDSSKREKYDNVLKNGLPNWKSALYYYRHVRKMGLAEMSIILFVILTVGQYIISWAAYAEKKYTAESVLGSKVRRMQKKNKTNVDMEAILNEIPPPSVFNTLPFQIPKAIWNIPSGIKCMYLSYRAYKIEQEDILRRRLEEEEEQKRLEEEFIREKEAKKEGMRKRKEKFAAKEKTDEELKGYSKLKLIRDSGSIRAANAKDTTSGGLWTDEDLMELIRLVKKYPGGTSARWEVIAEMMNRTVHEITFMAAKLKENGYRVPGQTDSIAENIVLDAAKKKVKAAPINPIILPETNWSQEQQQLLEVAIVKFPKNTATDRWEKIASTIPGKSKEECLARYKHLVEIVKAQKLKEKIESKQEEEEKMQKASELEINQTDDDKIVEAENVPTKTKSKSKSKPQQQQPPQQQTGGKPRNKRKERKNKMDFSSSDEDDYDDEE